MKRFLLYFLLLPCIFIGGKTWVELVYYATFPMVLHTFFPLGIEDIREMGRSISVTDPGSVKCILDAIYSADAERREKPYESYSRDDYFALVIHDGEDVVDSMEFSLRSEELFKWNGEYYKSDTLYFYVLDEIAKRDKKWEGYMRFGYGDDMFPFRTPEGEIIHNPRIVDWDTIAMYYWEVGCEKEYHPEEFGVTEY